VLSVAAGYRYRASKNRGNAIAALPTDQNKA
jgi:hypothetical protein